MSTTKPLRARMLALLRAHGPLTATEAGKLAGVERTTARTYLCRFVTAGLAVAVKEGPRTGSTSHVEYKCVPKVEQASRNMEKPYRPVHKKWDMNFKRDELVTALFGAAKQNGECHE